MKENTEEEYEQGNRSTKQNKMKNKQTQIADHCSKPKQYQDDIGNTQFTTHDLQDEPGKTYSAQQHSLSKTTFARQT